ncbi:hypothetical protein EXN66_Car019442 [Channa argus]|uniref:Uncharacterized protein n=1 Tax=Channa argus TaxID=215402 RepID=A0A6G1QMQ7_CHAAH|nr:hypothetical protein EXN66_Car019442 [Channa argus]
MYIIIENVKRCPYASSCTLLSCTRVKTDAEPPAGLCSLCVHLIMFQSTTSYRLLPALSEAQKAELSS